MGLPSWANEIWSPDNITVYQKVLNLEDQMKQVNYDTPEKAKFTGGRVRAMSEMTTIFQFDKFSGPLLGEMIDRMQQKINKAPATKKKTPRLKTLKVYMYSAVSTLFNNQKMEIFILNL